MSKTWSFPPSGFVQSLGSSGSGTDQFSNEPINNLAREIIQNSLDARSGDKPVHVEFHLFSTPISDFPGIDSFADYVLQTYNQFKTNPKADPKEKAFISSVLSALKQKKISWLRISDFHTTGLYGSTDLQDQNTPWFAFINGAGKNQKADFSGGSRGLGKNAIFANSQIRTMLVSTYSQDPESHKIEMANTGIAKLVSLILPLASGALRRDWTQGIGFCVEDTEDAKTYRLPSNGLLEIDPEFDRKSRGFGTDIYLPCFAVDDQWDETLIVEAITSFLPAIIEGDLVVRVTYEDTMVVKEIRIDSIQRYLQGTRKGKKEARALLKAYNSNQTRRIPHNESGFEMSLLMSQDNLEGLNEVYEYRWPTKMLIRHEKKECAVGFTGILLVQGKEICKRLRGVEDATHRKWTISRYKESGYEKEEISQALSTLNNFVESECAVFGSMGGEEKVFFEVAGWNAEEDIHNMSVDEQKDFGLPTSEVVCNRKADTTVNPRRKPYKKKGNVIDSKGEAETDILDIGEPGSGDGEYRHPEGNNQGKGGEIHPGSITESYDPETGEHLVMARKTIATVNAKMPSVKPQEGRFDLVFTPKQTGVEIEIEVLKAGLDGECEPTTIFSALLDKGDGVSERLEIRNNKIIMDEIDKGVEYRIHLDISETKNYIWEINVDGKE